MRNIVRILASMLLLVAATACEHKELCYHHPEHAPKYQIEVVADYRYDWEEHYSGTDWKQNWPANYTPYDQLRPGKPSGLRVVNYSIDNNSNTHNIAADGGIITLFEGVNDILFYNNDTEYILFSRINDEHGASTRATTRSRTRSTYKSSKYADDGEDTMTPPDVLFANYYADYICEKVVAPVQVPVTLQPLVFTYKIRYGQRNPHTARPHTEQLPRPVCRRSCHQQFPRKTRQALPRPISSGFGARRLCPR